ncbi:MAG: hypothetical protein IKY83_09735 [Proteobacteria bacterium]|nr:hypothetical protein [Pseudomonadota bacterium]
MSNDRHLIIEDGTIGSLFRRVTLASIGLESMDDVPEQSFEVIDRADAFAARLLGGVSSVMPKIDSERLGTQATTLAEHIYSGMSGLNGPKSATDLGDWQYWLDAALLMLFDEDEEEESVSTATAKGRKTNATTRTSVRTTPEAIRTQIAALKKSGVTPAMLQSMPQQVKRQLVQELGIKPENASSQHAYALAEKMAKALNEAKTGFSAKIAGETSSLEKIFARSSRQNFASHMADKAAQVGSFLGQSSAVSAEATALAQKWSEAVRAISTQSHVEMSAVREMFGALDRLEKLGAVSHEQAQEFRKAGSAYTRRVLMDEIAHDTTAVLGRLESMSKAGMNSESSLVSPRAISIDSAISHDIIKSTLASLTAHLADFNSAVSSRVFTDGESAATLRWSRAADRFTRLQGMSDDVDRILLRDIVESATSLKEAGIVPASFVNSILKAVPSESQTKRYAATQIQNIGQNAEFSPVAIKQSFESLRDRITELSTIVSEHVSKNGSSEAASRWIQTAEKFSQLPAMSDDSARVILKEILEDAKSLKAAGIISDTAVSEITKNVPESVRRTISFAAPAESSRILGSMASRIESSISRLVQDFVKSGATSTGIESFVTDIRQMLSTGNAASSRFATQPQAASVIESICNRLDEFAQNAAATATTYGYDDLATEGTYVSVSERSPETDHVQSSGNIRAIQEKLQNEIRAAQAKANAELKAALSAQDIANASISKASLKLVSEGDLTAEQIRAILPAVSEDKKQSIEAATAIMEQRQAQLGAIQKQMSVVESALKLSAELRKATQSGNAVRMDDIRVNNSYLTTLGNSLASYARVRNSARSITQTDAIVQPESRIEKMLSIIRPADSGMLATSEQKNTVLQQLSSTETLVGYDELVPSSLEWLKTVSPEQKAHYPASAGADLSSMLGSRKSFEIHAADIANGRTDGFSALANSIQKLAAEGSRTAVMSSYQTTDEGDRVKVSMNVAPQDMARNSFALRQNTGMSYMPASIRSDEPTRVMAASLNIQRASERNAVSGVDSFVPVSAGMNTGMLQSESQGRNAVRAILSKLGASFVDNAPQATSDRFRLTVGGVDFDMTSSAFVQMVAKPAISSASISAPSLVNADNILFSGYASLLGEHGSQRTLKSLRQAYVDSIARAGKLSAHSEIGFSTQSFANVLGITPEFVAPKAASKATAQQNSNAAQQEVAFSNDLVAKTMPIETTAGIETDNLAWVSNELRATSATRPGTMQQVSQVNEQPQLLSRIDNLLDYVENVSERNVGVFSTDDTVRVLLEAMPTEGSLGNKGLPKWRQKNTPATRMVEARELRDALAKIGATPIQGVQRFSNKQYVSPNLIQQQANSAPLFSGGAEGANTPGASANASSAGSAEFDNSSIADEDLQFIAEEVFHKIEESLNEEHQRRRSE